MRFLVPRRGLGMVWRTLLAGVIIVGCCAGAVATAALLQVDTIVTDISVHPGIQSKQLTLPKPGKPETLLVIGSDHRYGESYRTSNTDTMLLIRLNASSSTINVMSIPRDLEVDIPGYGTNKINAAYSLGSYSLLLKTIKADVFPHLKVNHIVDVNFTGFSDIIDAIGCVYSDVDHRYYNISAPGVNDYSSIDIQPGYQRLCGHDQSIHGALPFVRFRHTDSDFVRQARQQDFLRWAKQGFSISQLVSERGKLLHILGHHSTFDKNLQSPGALIELFNLVAFSDGDTINQIPFPGTSTVDGAVDYVVPTSTAAVAQAYREFMHPTAKASKSKPSTAASASHAHRHHRARHGLDTSGLTPDPADGLAQAKALTHPGMPVYYPRLIATSSDYCTSVVGNCNNIDEPSTAYAHSYPRQYLIPMQNGHKVHAYRMTLDVNAALGQYYGIQGVQWKDPPLLNDPTATKKVDGRKLFIYKDDGGHVTTVAWHLGENTYWVSNTLTSNLPNSEMIGIAASMIRYRG